jgi:hypothetical protein
MLISSSCFSSVASPGLVGMVRCLAITLLLAHLAGQDDSMNTSRGIDTITYREAVLIPIPTTRRPTALHRQIGCGHEPHAEQTLTIGLTGGSVP